MSEDLGLEIYNLRQRVLDAHLLHFHILFDHKFMFLLPVLFSLAIYPSFHLALFHPHSHFTPSDSNNLSLATILLPLFLDLLVLCCLATITYTTTRTNKPFNLVSSIKTYFFPLLPTLMISQTVSIIITLLLAAISVFLVQILKYLGLHTLDLFNFFGFYMVMPILIWLQVDWSAAYVVAVFEPTICFEAVRRTESLVMEKRRVAFLMMLVYGIIIEGIVIEGFMRIDTISISSSSGLRLLLIFISYIWLWTMSVSLVKKAAMYMYFNRYEDDDKCPAIV